MTNPLELVLEKYFKGREPLYYTTSDAIKNEQYLQWEYYKGKRGEILITIGSNDGETAVHIFDDPERLEQFIKLVIFNF